MNDKFLNLLGMARRAGKLSLGHDAAKGAVRYGKAQLVIISEDASQRLREEFEGIASSDDRNTEILFTDYTMYAIGTAIGSKAGVLTVDDKGFAERLSYLYNEQHKED